MRAAMPKTPSHLDCDEFARPRDVRMPRHLPLQSVARQSCFSQALAHQQFGLRVRPLVALHAFVHRIVRCGWGRDAYGHDVDAAFAGRRDFRASCHKPALDAARRWDFAQRSGFRGFQKRQQLFLPAHRQTLQLPSCVRGARRGKHVRRQPHLPLQVALVQPSGRASVADHGADMRRFQHALHLRGDYVLDACVARSLDVARGYDVP